jgi:hypothetical protein
VYRSPAIDLASARGRNRMVLMHNAQLPVDLPEAHRQPKVYSGRSNQWRSVDAEHAHGSPDEPQAASDFS